MASEGNSWPCVLAKSVAPTLRPVSKHTYCKAAVFVGDVCSHGQGFLLMWTGIPAPRRAGRAEYGQWLGAGFAGDILQSQQTGRNFLSLIGSVIHDEEMPVLLSVGSFRGTSEAAWPSQSLDTLRWRNHNSKCSELIPFQVWDDAQLWWMCSLGVFPPVQEGRIVAIWHPTQSLHQTCRGKSDSWAEIIRWKRGSGADREMHKFPAAGPRRSQDPGVKGTQGASLGWQVYNTTAARHEAGALQDLAAGREVFTEGQCVIVPMNSVDGAKIYSF